MADQRPPRLAGDERQTLLALLQYQRDSLVRKLGGLDEEQARRQLVPTGISLLWLVKHLTSAETTWVLNRFANRNVARRDDTVHADDSVADAISGYVETAAIVDRVIAASSLDEPCHGLEPGEEMVNLRWIIGHLLEETARHAGHADILRELIDGQTGR